MAERHLFESKTKKILLCLFSIFRLQRNIVVFPVLLAKASEKLIPVHGVSKASLC